MSARAEARAALKCALEVLAASNHQFDTAKMAASIGAARYSVCHALQVLGDPQPMRDLRADLSTSLRERTS